MRRWVAIWVILAVVFFMFWGCGPREDNSEGQGEQAKEVRVTEAKHVSVQKERSFAGTARASETVPLSFEIDGRLRS
ncbi:MAG: hypothetical protein K9K39_09675, partial [Desulfohalobiaceae bacterium]|nr:hypothetical protein [Desulfohalobiaceae bacterium]